MKAFYYIIAAILIVAPWVGNAQMNTNSLLPACSYDDRATCAPQKRGTRIMVTDASDATCSDSSGSSSCVLEYDGSAWGLAESGTVPSGSLTFASGTVISAETDGGRDKITITAKDGQSGLNIECAGTTTQCHITIKTIGVNAVLNLGGLESGAVVRLASEKFQINTDETTFGGGTFVPPSAASNPGTCTVGMLHFNTGDATLYVCVASNTWDDLAFVP